MLKHVIIKLKNEVKYQTVIFNNQPLKILGVGKKAIKYSLNGQEPEFAYHDSNIGFTIAQVVLGSLIDDVDINPYCETHHLTAHDTCDCCLCKNFEYCY